MQRIKTQFEYQDATILDFEWLTLDELLFRISLDLDESIVSLRFVGIRNRAEVDSQLMKISEEKTHDHYVADLVDVIKERSNTFVVDTSQHAIRIEARSMLEF